MPGNECFLSRWNHKKRIFLRELQVQSWFSREWFLFYSHVNKDGQHSLLLSWGSSSPCHGLNPGWCYLNELGLSPIMKQGHKTWHLPNISLLSLTDFSTVKYSLQSGRSKAKCLCCCIENVWATRWKEIPSQNPLI